MQTKDKKAQFLMNKQNFTTVEDFYESWMIRVTLPIATVLPDDLRNTLPRALLSENVSTQTG